MKIRLMGTAQEIDAVLPVITKALVVREVSEFYPNRGVTIIGRVYVDVDGPRAEQRGEASS